MTQNRRREEKQLEEGEEQVKYVKEVRKKRGRGARREG